VIILQKRKSEKEREGTPHDIQENQVLSCNYVLLELIKDMSGLSDYLIL
jgi:hypothetical protein